MGLFKRKPPVTPAPKKGGWVKPLLTGTAAVGGTAWGLNTIYDNMPSGLQEFTQDVMPGDSEGARLAIERRRLREEQQWQFNLMRPYNLTPEEQMQLSRLQSQFAADKKLEYQSLANVRNAYIDAMSNRIGAHISAMNNTNQMVQNIMSGSKLY